MGFMDFINKISAIRLLSKLALAAKICHFCPGFLQNFESMCEHMVEKFCRKDAKKGDFSDQMEFRKKSNMSRVGN